MIKYLLLVLLPIHSICQSFTASDKKRCIQESKSVIIIRDNFGIPHVYGKTDANAVFGLLYAQCEDDFQRVEMNYIEKLGRVSEIKGVNYIYNDLQIRMLFDSIAAISDYKNSPTWLKKLLNAYADGINYFLYTHPKIHPFLLNHFEPWYALMWTDGSIGAIDVGDVTLKELHNFYAGTSVELVNDVNQPDLLTNGSNGFALGPSKTASGNSILYINPHVTFYFRPEVHFVSEEGLNAYGAVTWGQIFIYQGFNEHCGWMHTSSYADVADLYAESIQKRDNNFYYSYDGNLKRVEEKNIKIKYSINANGKQLEKSFKIYYTHHGPVMAERNGKWIAVKANNRSLNGFIQSWLRNKAEGFAGYKKTMELLSNTSNNTVFADDKGNIAYWHGNFMPKRDITYNWALPVDGSSSKTEWKGLHSLDEIIHVYNPKTGFIQNCNSTPFTVSGSSSPDRNHYPSYMAPDGENFRAINASRILSSNNNYTIDKIIHDGYDPHLSAFDLLIPALLTAYEHKKNESEFKNLDSAINVLKVWDKNTAAKSIATTIAIFWAEKLQPEIMKRLQEDDEMDQVIKTKRFLAATSDTTLLNPLIITLHDLNSKFGSWKTEWGNINRYQRLTGNLFETYDDRKPSLPDGYAASTWGCLPSFVSKSFGGSVKRYGYNGNSFICAVEFGKKVIAKSLLAGGESGDKNSSHFNDQALMYTKGIFKEVNFYKEDVLKNAVIKYHPGFSK